MASGDGPTALYFGAILRGSPNLAAEGGYIGIRRFEKRFAADGSDNMLRPAFMEALSSVGDNYMAEVKAQFAAKHGRTGQTEQSIHEEFTPAFNGDVNAFQYQVVMGGGVGFVINPIGTHTIESTIPLADAMTGPFEGRTQDFYMEFPAETLLPLYSVEWYQGGADSYSPDTSWYDKDENADLAEWAFSEMAKLASRVNVLWGASDDTYGLVELSPNINTLTYG